VLLGNKQGSHFANETNKGQHSTTLNAFANNIDSVYIVQLFHNIVRVFVYVKM